MSWSWPWPLIYRQMASLATYLCAKVEVCSHLFLKYRGGPWHHVTMTDKNFTHFSRSPFSVFAVCTNMAQQFTLPLTINWQFFGSQLRIINYTGWHIKMSPVQNDCGSKTKTWSSVPLRNFILTRVLSVTVCVKWCSWWCRYDECTFMAAFDIVKLRYSLLNEHEHSFNWQCCTSTRLDHFLHVLLGTGWNVEIIYPEFPVRNEITF